MKRKKNLTTKKNSTTKKRNETVPRLPPVPALAADYFFKTGTVIQPEALSVNSRQEKQ